MFFSQAGAQPRTWEASPSERKKLVEVFKACDEDNKGYLSREDFKVAVVMLFGYKPSKIEANSVMSSLNPDTSDRGYLTLEDFQKAFKQVAPKLPERIILEVFRCSSSGLCVFTTCHLAAPNASDPGGGASGGSPSAHAQGRALRLRPRGRSSKDFVDIFYNHRSL
ncbi:EF-hand calcium-binding domain-containing protein 11 isoform X5 [Pteropus vampyrus]|uniref:EF-hand calcium-binding domain-containing protein 11 isoform X5 n=1 Tax=Pteropus vampyrus TaxID=132908 RepID=A0A6P6CB40_PTEVA|nr:EF-hand calcium-binding domain-containing protein 11 isoform X5 [Pteropus vampyrus]